MRWILLAAAMAAGHAQAATLRAVTTLHGPMVYVRDLFDDAGPNADRALGPGPAPGDRIIVGAAQLNAIARQYNIAWRSVSLADQATLEWPGRPLRRDEAVEAVRTAVTAAGAGPDCDIEVPGFAGPTVPTETAIAVTVSQLDFDANTGRFTAALAVTGEAMNAIDMRISGRVEEMVTAPVTVARLLAETVLREDDVRMTRVRASQVTSEVARSVDQIVGMQLRRPLPGGQVLRLGDLIRPPLVQRGALVTMILQAGGISVSGQGTAVDAGAIGEQVRVQNNNSRTLITAKVIGPGQVLIEPNEPALLHVPVLRLNRPGQRP